MKIEDTAPKEAIAECSFCGEFGHTYTGCRVLKQMVQEQAELLQQQRTEEYREAQSRSVRQTIAEEYGTDKDSPGRRDPQQGGVSQLHRIGADMLPSDRSGSQGRLPYPMTPSVARRVQRWEDEMPRERM